MEIYGRIYKITNNVTGKVYIGKTTFPIDVRFKGHMKMSSRCYYISAALKKYGKENFSIEEIAVAFSKEELAIKEKEFIVLNNSLVPNGYNIMFGDAFVKNSKQNRNLQMAAKQNKGWARTAPIQCYNIYTRKMTYFPRMVDAIKKTGLTKSIIEKNITFGRISNGYVFSYANQSGSARSNILEHAQRLGVETAIAEQNTPTSVRVPRLHVFSQEEKNYILELYKTRSAKKVAAIVGLENSRCKLLLKKWGALRTFSEAMEFRRARNMR